MKIQSHDYGLVMSVMIAQPHNKQLLRKHDWTQYVCVCMCITHFNKHSMFQNTSTYGTISHIKKKVSPIQ